MGGAELTERRLTVHEKPAARRQRVLVRGLGAVAATLLADDEQHADAALARSAEPLGRMNLRGQDALGVAGAAAVQAGALDPAREEGGNAVEVRGEDDRRWIERRDDIRSAAADFLFVDGPAEISQVGGKPDAAVGLAAGGRIDVDEAARERDEI